MCMESLKVSFIYNTSLKPVGCVLFVVFNLKIFIFEYFLMHHNSSLLENVTMFFIYSL